MCHQNLDWDEQIPDNMTRQWAAWKSNLLFLEGIKVERCFKPKKFGKIKEEGLHRFSDASEYGYGYLMAEVEGIMNSSPLTMETLSAVTSCKLLSPSDLLTMKSKFVLAPAGKF